MSNTTSGAEEDRCFKTIASSAPPIFQNGKIVLQAYHIGWIISGLFTFVALSVSFWLICKHLQWYTNKREQRYIVRLLIMVPLYAVISFASFLFWNHATPLTLIRDAYEAIVLTAFFYLLLTYLSHDVEEQKRIFIKAGLSVEADQISVRKGDDVVKWVFPLGFVKWKPRNGLYFLQMMKWGVLQYCVIRPTSTLAAVILNYVGLYCEDSWGLGWGHIYMTIIMSISVTVAMYCLLQLYFPVAPQLTSHQPLLKLFSVKAVVFLTFWQATFLSLLGLFGVIKDTKYMTADDVNNALAAILETFEMMLFAFVHIRAFTYKPYVGASKDGLAPTRTPQWRSFGHAMDFRETFIEIWLGCVYMFDSLRGKEPTSDFGVIRKSHYEGAFGRTRQANDGTRDSGKQTRSAKTTDLNYPAIRVEVDEEVEVMVNGKREWLHLDNVVANHGHPARQKSEGLHEQISRELALRGYPIQEQQRQPISNLQPKRTRLEGSWWRSLYNRISQSGQEPEQDIIQPLARRSTSRRSRLLREHKGAQNEPYINEPYPDKVTSASYPDYDFVHEEHNNEQDACASLLAPGHLRSANRPVHGDRSIAFAPFPSDDDGSAGLYELSALSSQPPVGGKVARASRRFPRHEPNQSLGLGPPPAKYDNSPGKYFNMSSGRTRDGSTDLLGSDFSPLTAYRESVHRREGAGIS